MLALSKQWPWYVLGGAAALLSMVLIYLALSRRGETRAVTKCVVLSIWAHFILLGFAYLNGWFDTPVGLESGRAKRPVSVTWIPDLPVHDLRAKEERGDRDVANLDGSDPRDAQRQFESLGPPVADHESSPAIHPGRASSDERSHRLIDEASNATSGDPSWDPPLSETSDAARLLEETGYGDLPEATMAESSTAPETLGASSDPGPEGSLSVDPGPLEADPLDAEPADADVLESNTEQLAESGSHHSSLAEPLMLPPERPDELPSELMQSPAAREMRTPDVAESPPTAQTRDPQRRLNSRSVGSRSQRPSSDFRQPPRELIDDTASFRDAASSRDRQPHATSNRIIRPVTRSKPTRLPNMYRGRMRKRTASVGTVDTEAAVMAALRWFAEVQESDGRWDHLRWQGGLEVRQITNAERQVRADTAVTGLALLSYFGSGHTHVGGDFQETVAHGLDYLLRIQATSGSLAGNASTFTAMYCHGMATLALSEAYIMTRDEQLLPPLRRAIDFTLAIQHPTAGGWRYRAGDRGDTSQFGWQVMSMVSAETAGIQIPQRHWDGARRWLQQVSMGSNGGLACYIPERRTASPSMTAEALVCRVFLRQGLHPATTEEATRFIAQFALQPEVARDLYFCYYASLALYQVQDPRWQQLNQLLSSSLTRSQRQSGSLAGSWDPNTKWGATGGRVYTTAMAVLCLETSYRYLPVYELAVRPRPYRR